MMRFEPLSQGVWQILPTPFRGRELRPDLDSLARVMAHARRVGVTGVVALGVLGEAARLNESERAEVLGAVVTAAGEMPVVAGVSAMATAPAIDQAARAAQLGARAVMVLVNTGNRAQLAEHLAAVAEATGLGIVVQDHPASTGISISTEALVGAVSDTRVAVAVKAEAPPTPATVAAVKAVLPALPVFGGLGGVSLMDELAAGADGAMTGFAFPEALVATVTKFHDDGFASAKRLLEPYLPAMVFEAQGAVSLAVRKELLRRRGLIDEASVRPPGSSLPRWAETVIDAHLEALGPARVHGTTEVHT